MSDESTYEAPKPAGSEVPRLLGQLTRFALLLLAGWLLMTIVQAGLPYIRPGAVLIYEAKQDRIESGKVFESGAGVRVAVFGDSRILSGFRPEVFDALGGPGFSSFNLALPDSRRFQAELTALCARGEVPTHVFLTVAWSDDPVPRFDPFRPLPDDTEVLESLVPFRDLPRNLTLFLLRSITRGGPRTYYRAGALEIEKMLAARGWYFIEDSSHFPEHRLPEDFELESDTPTEVRARSLDPTVPAFEDLTALAEEHDLRIVYIPVFYRQGAFAPAPPENVEAAAVLADSERIRLLGPDYWLFPNRLFSDPVHVNPDGAEIYTRRVWQLVEPLLSLSGETAGRDRSTESVN